MDNFVDKTITRVFSKKDFQQLRTDFKAQGFSVNKTEDEEGYELKLKDGRLLLKALKGNNGYLVRMVHNLLS